MYAKLILVVSACTLIAAGQTGIGRYTKSRPATLGSQRRAVKSRGVRQVQTVVEPRQLSEAGGERAAIDQCTITAISPGEVVTGRLDEADCAAQDVMGRSFSGRADLFRLATTDRRVLRISVQSPDFSPGLGLLRGDTGIPMAAVTGGQNQRELIISVEPETYLIAVTGTGGAYTLTALLDDLRTCDAQQIAIGQEVEGTLTDADCRRLDYVTPSSDASPLERYEMNIDRRSVLTIDTDSPAFPPQTVVYDSRGRQIGSRRRTEPGALQYLLSVERGTYTVEVRGVRGISGAYKLRVAAEAPRECATNEVTPGQPVDGELTSSDCRYLDLFSFSTDATPVDVYSVLLDAKRVLTTEMKSGGFDTGVEFYSADMEFLEFADDYGDSTDTRLRISLEPGRYVIVAGLVDGSGGAYSLALTSDPLRRCNIVRLGTEDTRAGTLDPDTACRYLDLHMFSTYEDAMDLYRVTIARRGMLKTEVSSPEFDTVIVLQDLNYEDISFNDDASPDTTNAVMDLMLLPEDYLLIATHADRGRGAYEIRTSFRDPRQCPVADLAADGSADGDLNDADCRLSEVVPFLPLNPPADVFAMSLAETRRVTIEASSSGTAPSLIVQDANYLPRGAWFNFGEQKIGRVAMTLPRGRYEVIAIGLSGPGGQYSLRSTTAPVQEGSGPTSARQ